MKAICHQVDQKDGKSEEVGEKGKVLCRISLAFPQMVEAGQALE
jgi:hypothetical protein